MKKVLNKFTIRNLKQNRKRTIATIIGIILSTAMICTVAGVFSSLQETAIQHTIEADGDYHTIFYNVPKEEQKYILENRNVESVFITQAIGYAELKESKADYEAYLQLKEFDEEALNNFGLILTEGRMPENENELIISKRVREDTENFYNIGDKITLEIGEKIADGPNETLQIKETREFTIVGIIETPNLQVDRHSDYGYTVITKMTEQKENIDIAVKFKNIKDTYKLTREIAEDKTADQAKMEAYLKSVENPNIDWIPKYAYETNTELLRWSGVSDSDDTMQTYYSLVAIIVVIIVVTSAFIIRNSFEISITEKIKQYGILSSVGATGKQIKRNALFEGMILGIIAIPIGILLGILATYILIQITTILIGKVAFADPIICVFNVPFTAIILSIVLGFVTIYLSCIFAARRASKITPIDAIKRNEELKIKNKDIKCPSIIKKVFGVGGEIAYKNLKRNKKKYRTIVISLIVSITVFISISAFIGYSFKVAAAYEKAKDYNIRISVHHADYENDEVENYYQYLNGIATEFNLEKYTIKRTTYMHSKLEDKMTEEYKEIYLRDYEEKWRNMGMMITLTSLGEEEYRDYVEKIGGKYEDYKDGIIYYDNSRTYNDKKEQIQLFNFSPQDEINGMITETQQEINLKIVEIADEAPMASEIGSAYGMFIISDELMDKIGKYECNSMMIHSKNSNSYELCKKIEERYEEISEKNNFSLSVMNYQKDIDRQNGKVLLVSIFLYGFIAVISLIAITNIFNIISTNINLRSKEFAMLKSIGMTDKEFNRMINLENIFYAFKSLLIGIILGTGISYWIYAIAKDSRVTIDLDFIFPIKPIIICMLFVAIIVNVIMKYSLNKINKQNIIESIRKYNR